MQCTGGHQNLVGFGGKAALAISFGDGLPQYVDADKLVAHLVQVWRHVVDGVDERFADRGGGGGQRGGGEAHRRRGDLYACAAAGATGSAVVLRAPRRALR